MWIGIARQKKVNERTTYSCLDWLGDVGGLFDGLLLVTQWMVQPIVTFVMQAKLLSSLFRQDDNKDLASSWHDVERITPPKYCKTHFCCDWKTKRRLKLAEAKVAKQLDLETFIKQHRMRLLSMLLTLSVPQYLLLDNHSELLIEK